MQRGKSLLSQNAICSIKPLFIALFPKVASSAAKAMKKVFLLRGIQMSLRIRLHEKHPQLEGLKAVTVFLEINQFNPGAKQRGSTLFLFH